MKSVHINLFEDLKNVCLCKLPNFKFDSGTKEILGSRYGYEKLL